jgi:hypothetical protein
MLLAPSPARRFGSARVLTPILATGLLTACAHPAPLGKEPAATVAIPSATSARLSDPPYPVTTDPVVSLTWQFSRTLGESDGGPERDLDVVVHVGGSVRRVRLNRHRGTLVPSQQSVCDGTLKDARIVSRIELNTMGPETIVARRVAPTVLEISFTVDADDEPAKTHGVLARIAIPAEARVIDQVREVREDGTEAPLDCSSSAR